MLVKAAGDADAGVRAAAVTTLGALGDDAAADGLGRLAAEDPVASVRINAVDGLERCASDKAIVYLIETAEKNDDVRVQQHARSAVMRRLRMPARTTRPRDLAMWRNDLELVKVQPAVVSAYRQAGVKLVLHPEWIIPEPGE